MEKVFIIRYCEIHLKGKNKSFFENLLLKNIRESLASVQCDVKLKHCRYVVSAFC